MRNTSLVGFAVAAFCYVLFSTNTRAEHEKESGAALKPGGKSVSELIGQTVVNERDESLGKVQDIIVDTGTARAPYAIIALSPSVSTTQNKVAVPLRELKCSSAGKPVVLRATTDALRTATKNGSGEWSTVRDADWAQKVDGFYGASAPADGRYSADPSADPRDSRKFVRDPAPKGGELLITPNDAALADKICENLDVVHVRVQNGVTHLYGTVPSDQARQELETRVRGVAGVNTLESHLRVRTP